MVDTLLTWYWTASLYTGAVVVGALVLIGALAVGLFALFLPFLLENAINAIPHRFWSRPFYEAYTAQNPNHGLRQNPHPLRSILQGDVHNKVRLADGRDRATPVGLEFKRLVARPWIPLIPRFWYKFCFIALWGRDCTIWSPSYRREDYDDATGVFPKE